MLESRTLPRCDHHLRSRDDLRAAAFTDLVHAPRQGSQEVWEEMVHRFSPILRRRVGAVTTSIELADDAIQNTWLKLALSLDAIREPERVIGWLCTTARNEVINLVRPNSRLVLSCPTPANTPSL